MIAVSKEAAGRDPCCHIFTYGRGYVHIGHPAMPAKAAAPPSAAEPPPGTTSGSWHHLNPPQGGAPVALRWDGKPRAWMPVLGTGNRLGYSPTYLAAHGWTYSGPKEG